MERTNADYLQMIFDKYEISHNDSIGFDFEENMYITAYDLLIKFIHLEHQDQLVVMCDIVAANCNKCDKKEMLNELFDAYLHIKKINRIRGNNNA